MTAKAAFPSGTSDRVLHDGMTLRDYYAGQALAGLMSELGGHLANELDQGRVKLAIENSGKLCFAFADAMLKAR